MSSRPAGARRAGRPSDSRGRSWPPRFHPVQRGRQADSPAIGVSYGLARKRRTETAFRAREAFGAAVEASVVAGDPGGATARADDGALDPLVDALQARRVQWMAAHTGDAASYGPRLRDKLTARLLDQGDGVGRLWRLAVLQAVAALWAPAGPDRGPLDARGLRAWLAMLRSIVLALEPETPAGSRSLPASTCGAASSASGAE